MKRYEVRRHLMHADFPWQQQYTLSSGCPLQAGQRLPEVVWGTAKRTHTTSSIHLLYDSRFSGGRRASYSRFTLCWRLTPRGLHFQILMCNLFDASTYGFLHSPCLHYYRE